MDPLAENWLERNSDPRTIRSAPSGPMIDRLWCVDPSKGPAPSLMAWGNGGLFMEMLANKTDPFEYVEKYGAVSGMGRIQNVSYIK